MSNNSRILTTDGKSTNGAKCFGFTVKDRQSTTTPNMTQLTIIPATDTVQNHKFILGTRLYSLSGTPPAIDFTNIDAPSTITIVPDLILATSRFYQFNAYLTVILKIDNTNYLTGHYLLTSAAKGQTIIGGSGGYRLDTICSEDGIDSYLVAMSTSVEDRFIIELLLDIRELLIKSGKKKEGWYL